MSNSATATTNTSSLRRHSLSSSGSSSFSKCDHFPVEEVSRNRELDQVNHLVNWNCMFTMDGYTRRPVEMSQVNESEKQHPELSPTHRAPSDEEEQHPELSPSRRDPYEVAEGPQKLSSTLSHSLSVPSDACRDDTDAQVIQDNIQQPTQASSSSTRASTHRISNPRISKPRQRQIQTRSQNQKPRRGRGHRNHAKFLELDERGTARRTSR
ncbi:hypothetical protein F4860DRAFT_482792 [Xylaria cubensis]|nr:hypothetical protein F4860DRAFT_482792 [Xylaria cubensis]